MIGVNLVILWLLGQQIWWPQDMRNSQHTGVFPTGILETDNVPPSIKWSRNIPIGYASSVAIGDVDVDGEMDVIVASLNGVVYSLRGPDGATDWSFPIGSRMDAAPAITNLDGDNALEIIVGARDSILRAIDGVTHTVQWSNKLDGWIYGAICIADLDNNGSDEVIVGTFNYEEVPHYVWAYYGDGELKWSRLLDKPISASPSVGDINNDGQVEVVVGTYSSFPFDGGTLYALNGNTGDIIWTYSVTGRNTISRPVAIAEVTGDDTVDVLMMVRGSPIIRCLNGITRRVQWEYSRSGILANPAVGNVDSDPDIEIVLSYYGGGGILSPGICCINGRGEREWYYNFDVYDELCYGASILVDITLDNILDVVVGVHSGRIYGVRSPGILLWDNPDFDTDIEGAVAVGDLDNDGCLDIAGGGYQFDEKSPYNKVYAIEFPCATGVEEGVTTERELEEKFKFITSPGKLRMVFDFSDYEAEFTVYDIVGRQLKSFVLKNKGELSVFVQSGIYFYRIKSKNFTRTGKFVIL
jgi:outer membrane protein assembly factor BamB